MRISAIQVILNFAPINNLLVFSCSYFLFKIYFKMIPKKRFKTDTAGSRAVTNCREALSKLMAEMTKTVS